MKRNNGTIPSGLAQWLEMATEGIAAAGKERIGREIGAHYAEAVVTHEGKGMMEEQAREKALEELGKPRAARRRLRRTYLTVEDEKYINDLHQAALRPMKSKLLAWHFLVMTFICGIPLNDPDLSRMDQGLFFVLWIVEVLLFPATAHVLAKFSRSESIKMMVLDIDFLSSTLLVVVMAVFFGSEMPKRRCDWIFLCGLALFKLGRLWQKRRKAVRPGGGTPTAA